nr:heme ABC exporter ATP-binding protein CcmA [Afifella sp. H1R]
MVQNSFPSPISVNAEDLACERGGRPIFEGVSFSLSGGEVLAIVGPNGTGKSSLLRMIAGLLFPVAGSVTIKAGTLEEGFLHFLAYGDGLRSVFTVEENLKLWSRIYGGETGGEAIYDALEKVGLAHAMHLPARALSTGQRRRAGLARLVLSKRPVWLLDEPTSGLDRDGEAVLGGLMRTHLDAGGAIIAATHLTLPVPPTRTLELQ